MTRWVVLGVLAGLPLAGYLAVGVWSLWELGRLGWLWWPLPICWGIAFLLYRRWRDDLHPAPDFDPPMTWTDQDREAWKLVEARVKAGRDLEPANFTRGQFYADTARDLSMEMAAFYHPGSADPFGPLTIPELLAAAQLATEDLAELVQKYVPGSHELTVDRWRGLAELPTWYRTATNVWTALSAVWNPIGALMRYASSRATVGPLLQQMQENVQYWFYAAFLQRVGTALIELNSRRLRVGAVRWRELQARLKSPESIRQSAAPAPPSNPRAELDKELIAAPEPATEITVTLLGQVKAGKSSLINALLGGRQAVADVLPATKEITRYRLQPEGVGDRLVLLDTPGYSNAGPEADREADTLKAVRESDLVLLVTSARDPARAGDLKRLADLTDWFAANPKFKRPAVVAVLTHVDLLSPAMEWSPPYDWAAPKRPKERSIFDAVAFAAEQFGPRAAVVVPVCTGEGRVWGVAEGLLPQIVSRLDEARAVGLVRCLHAQADQRTIWDILGQLKNAASAALKSAVRGGA